MDDFTPEEKDLLRELGGSLEALGARHLDCPRIEVLRASQAGVLPEGTAQSIAAHIKKCSFCQILLKDLANEELTTPTGEEARRVRERVFTAIKPGTKGAKAGGGRLAIWLWKAIPVAALAGAAIALFVWTRLHKTTPPIPSQVAIVQPATKPVPPPSLQWEKLPIKLQAQSVLVWRGKPRTAQERYASELTSALTYYRDDHFDQAVEKLSKVVKDFPRGVEGQLYLGISDLKTKRNADAIEALRAAQKLGPDQFRDDAIWYLALALDRTGDIQGAVAELTKLCQGKSSYAAQACAAAKESTAQPGATPRK